MEVKVLIIGVVRNGSQILLRKKPDGSAPYEQTWYLFGGELTGSNTPSEAITNAVKQQTGLEIVMCEAVGWDKEVKKDLDGVTKQFIYLDALCDYVSGEIVVGAGIEKIEWVEMSRLGEYDHVPPSKKLFIKLGYLDD